MQDDGNSRAELEAGSEVRAGVSAGTDLAGQVEAQRERKFWISMGMYAVLALLCWFTLGEGTTSVLGRRVEIRWIPLFILGTFVFRSYIAREADKIRRRSQQ